MRVDTDRPALAIAPEVLWELGDDGVAVITFNRPQARNAQTARMEADFLDLLTRADEDARVRAVVLTAAGDTFCVGADISYLEAYSSGFGDSESIPHPLAAYAAGVRKPVIAALNGSVAGVGLVYAITCDVRFICERAKITTAFARRGLVAERSLAWHLPRVVGHAAAMDLALSARVVTAEEALRIGLVNRVFPDAEVLPAAMQWARDVAVNCSPTAVATIKAQLNRSLSVDLETSLREANGLAVEMFRKPDVAEGVASFVEKRVPRFPALESPSVDTAGVHIRGPETA